MVNFTGWSSLRKENHISMVNLFILVVRMHMKLLWLLTSDELRGLSYIDLYLIFCPNGDFIWIWAVLLNYLTIPIQRQSDISKVYFVTISYTF